MSKIFPASVQPTKSFFIEMLTRDIALEDALLDLVDNSIDALGRARHLDFSSDIMEFLADQGANAGVDLGPQIKLELSDKEFVITDNCGGISFESATSDVFRIGRTIESSEASLGVYGIGLKRALFKIGKEIKIVSRTVESGFSLTLDVEKWASDDDDWTFPIEKRTAAKGVVDAGTKITIGHLNPEIIMRLHDGVFRKRLTDLIATTYALFIGRYLAVYLDGVPISPRQIPVGTSDDVKPEVDTFDLDGVAVTLLATLADRRRGEWNTESAGWYVLCNGRVVVAADKTELTGWGVQGARFVSKFRGFIGVAFFFSRHPQKLPWTTTKRGLNLDSPSFQRARTRMIIASKKVLSFLNKMYPNEAPEEPRERKVADQVRFTDIRKIVAAGNQSFEISAREPAVASSAVNVQFKADWSEIERIKKCLRKPSWSAGRVGRYTLEYFIDQECPE